ncbi:MAG: replicative DNA helicase [Ignavibacteriota bacterium]|nr:MAG: replicative DNA helicase [Ignavibacteriota bacterium]
MQKILEKTPPHNLDSEMYVLGAILLDNEVLEKISHLKKEHFYKVANQEIFKCMADLHNKQRLVDITLLRGELKKRSLLEKVGGELYLIELEECAPHSLAIEYHVGIIITDHIKRKQIEIATRIIQEAYNANVDSKTSIEELKTLLESENISSDIGIIEPKSIENEIDTLYKIGLQPGLSTGWISLDQYYTIKEGQLTIITGIPSHGKSQFNTNLLVNIANRYHWKFAVFSPENQPIQRHAAQIISMCVGKPFSLGANERLTEGEFIYAKDWIQQHFVFLHPPDNELTIDHIINKAKICALKYGIKGLVIDPWNEIDHSRPANLSETEYISLCLTKLRRLARMYQLHIWLIAHPTKLMKRIDGTYPVPTPYDISGSAHWRNKADCCLCVWRDIEDEGKKVQIHIQKIRFREVGKVGVVELIYDQSKNRYIE